MKTEPYKIITVNAGNIDQEHICCAIGHDKTNRERANIKKNWMKQQFPAGHTFKKADVRGKVFIEYTPAENAWFPIQADGYTFIQCLWVSGRYQGKGISPLLLDACEQDSKQKNDVIALTTTKKMPFFVDKKFYLKQGFEVVDEAAPYFELMVKKYKKDAPNPQFMPQAKTEKIQNKKGMVFYYTDMCPFISGHIENMIKVVQEREMNCDVIKIETLQQAKAAPCPFGIFSVFLNGKFLTYELMLEKKFNALLDKQLK